MSLLSQARSCPQGLTEVAPRSAIRSGDRFMSLVMGPSLYSPGLGPMPDKLPGSSADNPQLMNDARPVEFGPESLMHPIGFDRGQHIDQPSFLYHRLAEVLFSKFPSVPRQRTLGTTLHLTK